MIARLGQRRRVGDGKRDVEHARERLRKQRLADAGRAEQQDVRLAQLHIADIAEINALVMVINRDRKRDFGALLPNDIFVQLFLDLVRLEHGDLLLLPVLAGARRGRRVVVQHALAKLHAFVTDAYARPGDQPLNLVLHLAAE